MILRALKAVLAAIDATSRFAGVVAMGLFFLLLGLLTYGVISNAIFNSPAIWLMEMAQFTMAAYYVVGGGYTLQQGAHVRMDLLYGRWTPRVRSGVDVFTGLFLMFFLGVLVWGGVQSSMYALQYNQKNYSSWSPPLAPIKIIVTAGMFLMLLQAFALWVRDVAQALGKKI